MRRIETLFVITCCFLVATARSNEAQLQSAVAVLREVGPEGAGSKEAAESWQLLSKMGPGAIVPLLESMNSSSALARNWIRSAVEVIYSNTLKHSPGELPIQEVTKFLQDTSQVPQARKLAFDLLESADSEAADALRGSFLLDPSPDLRRESVALLIEQGQKELSEGEIDSAVRTLQTGLDSARDVAQIKTIASLLREEAKQELDLPRQFGFLMHWHVIGPFDNSDRKGFDRVFAPEESVDLAAKHQGKTREISWQSYVTTDEYGMVDFNQPFNPLKEVVAYAYTEFFSPSDQRVELRLGCKNAWKIWVNGTYVFGRDEYHRGMRIDQYKLPVQFKEGKNTILVKACQDEQERDWTKEWQFQLRICDASGTAVLSEDRKPTPRKKDVAQDRR